MVPWYVWYNVNNYLFGIITIGKIKRETADALLQPKPSGMYLVRLSHKIWGYTISVKGIYNTIQITQHYNILSHQQYQTLHC